jgi:hypothetical protein
VIREWLTTQSYEILAEKSSGTIEPAVSNGDAAHLTEPADLTRFAERVQEAARISPSGRFGDNKVFLSHVWKQYQGRGNGMTREEFDRLLVEANRQNLLTLSRADLVSAMSPEDVHSSEIRLPNSTFHFIRTDC